MTKLFSPIKIRDLEIKNRLWVSPMCMYSCEGQDGVVGQWHLVHLGSRAMGGAGMVIAEASAVSPEGRISPWCPGLYDDDQIAPWKVITDFIREQGATSGIQLAHAGRKGSTHRPTSGSGSVATSEGGWRPTPQQQRLLKVFLPPGSWPLAKCQESFQILPVPRYGRKKQV